MKKRLLIMIGIADCLLAGCASFTGITKWKENTYVSPLDRAATIKIATEAIAQIGTVSFSDTNAGTVNGECASQVEGAVTVNEEDGKTIVVVKSKINAPGNSVIIETGDRKNCITHIVEEMKALGCNLSPALTP